nr:MAG TPA: hypothetical protein [Caudoviricetes sp.]
MRIRSRVEALTPELLQKKLLGSPAPSVNWIRVIPFVSRYSIILFRALMLQKYSKKEVVQNFVSTKICTIFVVSKGERHHETRNVTRQRQWDSQTESTTGLERLANLGQEPSTIA